LADDLEALASQFSAPVAELTRRCVALVAEELPTAAMKVYAGGWKNAQFRVDHDILAAVNPLAAYVNVNLGHATELDDPDGVLEGTGKGIRHVKVRPGLPFPEQQLRCLLQQLRERFVDE
jgi:hypothetical protein